MLGVNELRPDCTETHGFRVGGMVEPHLAG